MNFLSNLRWMSCCILVQLLFITFVSAQTGKHTKRVYTRSGQASPLYFWQYNPPGYDSLNASVKHPVIIFLHGAGERVWEPSFSTLDSVTKNGIPFEIKKGANMCFSVNGEPERCFIVLSPQKKQTSSTDTYWPTQTYEMLRYMNTALASKIDTSRIYITGLSMGGIGTLKYIQSTRSWAEDFAAAAVAPGGGADFAQACIMNTNDVNFWAVHGTNDPQSGTSYQPMKDFIDSVNACTPPPIPPTLLYSIPGGTHNVWRDFYHTGADAAYTPAVTYSPNVYEWFLMNPKGGPNVSSNQRPFVSTPSVTVSGNTVSISATASDNDGVVEKVEFYEGSNKIGEDTSSPYSYTWTNVPLGTYTITANAVDNGSRFRTSSSVTANVITGVQVTSPINAQIFTAPATINITATASAATGSITKVEFYNGTTKLGEDLTSPYTFSWTNVASGTYSITATSTNSNAQVITSPSVNVTVNPSIGCSATGTITRDVWTGLPGDAVSVIPVSTIPASTSQLTSFEAPTGQGNEYGARIAGYICAPETGAYRFWVSGDDDSELWLSTTDSPNQKVRIVNLTSFTNVYEWDKYYAQKSALIQLTAGQRYYIEVLHKQALGNDHVEVGWQLPSQVFERPIPGTRLSPYFGEPATIEITSPFNSQTFTAAATIAITASVNSMSTVSKVEFFNGTSKIGEDTSAPYSFTWQNVAQGSYSLTATATNSAGTTTSAVVNVVVNACSSSGQIAREYWAGVPGNTIAAIPLNTTPTSVGMLTTFEGPVNIGEEYAARIRGYVCAPASGTYYFWICSDDNGELWVSSNDDPANKQRVAYVPSHASLYNWTKYPEQKSAAISLVAGQRYYIEALHKESAGNDHISVGWTLPSGLNERPILGSSLSPYPGGTSTARMGVDEVGVKSDIVVSENSTFNLYPNPVKDVINFDAIEDDADVRIFTTQGVVIQSERVQRKGSTISVAADKLPSGLYYVVVVTNKQQRRYKFVKE
jgi:hypothetical protein